MKKIIYVLLGGLAVLVVLFFVLGSYIPRVWETIDKGICSWRSGVIITRECNIERCSYKCTIPYKDGGKACLNSDQCSHHCITNDHRLPEPWYIISEESIKPCIKTDQNNYDCRSLELLGTCEKQEPANCENRWEINDGFITPVLADCSI